MFQLVLLIQHPILKILVKLNENFFSSFDTNIKTNYEMRATHSFATDNFGGPCEFPDLKYFINNWYVGKNNKILI
jgi:hypothetical protein